MKEKHVLNLTFVETYLLRQVVLDCARLSRGNKYPALNRFMRLHFILNVYHEGGKQKDMRRIIYKTKAEENKNNIENTKE